MKKVEIRADILAAMQPSKPGWTDRQQVELLQRMLSNGETVKVATWTQYGKRGGMLALTNKALLFAGQPKSVLAPGEQIRIPLRNVTSVSSDAGAVFTKLVVDTSGGNFEFKRMATLKAEQFSTALNEVHNTSGGHENTSTPASQLLQLKQLLDAGVLTEDEYEAKSGRLKELL